VYAPPVSLAPPSDRAFAKYDPRGAWVRLLLTLLAFGTTVVALRGRFRPAVQLVAAWDVSALVLLVLMWVIILRANAAETRRRASAEDPGRLVIWLIVMVASVVSLFAGAIVFPSADKLAPEARQELHALCLMAVAMSWLVTHTAYALRYAHLYYREEDGIGGLEFPGGEPPRDFDFAYFSFTVGMCFQVSDVVVSNHAIRRDTLIHAMISFAYNTAVLATVLSFALK
jgi:uncharacterized membrane protein